MPLKKHHIPVESALEALLPGIRNTAKLLANGLRDPMLQTDDLVSIATVAILEAHQANRHCFATDPERYLAGVGHNAMRKAVRDSEARRREKLPEPEKISTESAEDTVLRKLDIENYLSSIPEPLRETVQRRYLQEQSTTEIAAAMDVHKATVDRRILRALRFLHARFADEA